MQLLYYIVYFCSVMSCVYISSSYVLSRKSPSPVPVSQFVVIQALSHQNLSSLYVPYQIIPYPLFSCSFSCLILLFTFLIFPNYHGNICVISTLSSHFIPCFITSSAPTCFQTQLSPFQLFNYSFFPFPFFSFALAVPPLYVHFATRSSRPSMVFLSSS